MANRLSFFSQWPLHTLRQLLRLTVSHSLDPAAPILKQARKYFLLQWDQRGTLPYFKINFIHWLQQNSIKHTATKEEIKQFGKIIVSLFTPKV